MLRLRTHVLITAAIFVAMVVLAMVGNALEASGALAAGPGLRLASITVFFGLAVALTFAAIPVVVKLVLGFQASLGNAGNPAAARWLSRERAIVYTLWALITLGLAVAVPAAITAGAFD